MTLLLSDPQTAPSRPQVTGGGGGADSEYGVVAEAGGGMVVTGERAPWSRGGEGRRRGAAGGRAGGHTEHSSVAIC